MSQLHFLGLILAIDSQAKWWPELTKYLPLEMGWLGNGPIKDYCPIRVPTRPKVTEATSVYSLLLEVLSRRMYTVSVHTLLTVRNTQLKWHLGAISLYFNHCRHWLMVSGILELTTVTAAFCLSIDKKHRSFSRQSEDRHCYIIVYRNLHGFLLTIRTTRNAVGAPRIGFQWASCHLW
jgi:hypothetical protein